MNPRKLLKALVLPVTEPSVLLALLMFWLIVSIGTSGSVLGVFVLLLALPPLIRYQMIIIEAGAKGEPPGAFDAEFFNMAGNMWTLFPLPLVVGLVVLGSYLSDWFGQQAVTALMVVAGVLLPASIAVLAITRAPLQSLNPVAIARLLHKTGESFWVAPVYLLLVLWLGAEAESLHNIAGNLVQLFLLFSFAALTGALLEPYNLMAEVSIPDPVEASAAEESGQLERERAVVLSHAYGFASRGNREGGFKHVIDAIGKEADVAAAWAWYFDHMLQWEDQQHALFFAQKYIKDMLEHGENVQAVKVILRCRLLNTSFHPFREDLPRAIGAAEATGNIELAAVLKRI